MLSLPEFNKGVLNIDVKCVLFFLEYNGLVTLDNPQTLLYHFLPIKCVDCGFCGLFGVTDTSVSKKYALLLSRGW